MKRIIITNEKVLDKLVELKKYGFSKQERYRSHAMLLSNSGKKIKEIAKIFEVTNKTVYNWIDEWDKCGIDSIYRKKGAGRKPLLTSELHKEIIKKHIEDYPHQPKKAYALTLKEINIKVSYKTFKRFLKKYLN
jgi:transposase